MDAKKTTPAAAVKPVAVKKVEVIPTQTNHVKESTAPTVAPANGLSVVPHGSSFLVTEKTAGGYKQYISDKNPLDKK